MPECGGDDACPSLRRGGRGSSGPPMLPCVSQGEATAPGDEMKTDRRTPPSVACGPAATAGEAAIPLPKLRRLPPAALPPSATSALEAAREPSILEARMAATTSTALGRSWGLDAMQRSCRATTSAGQSSGTRRGRK